MTKSRKKPGSKWGNVTAQIIEALTACGPMTRAELCTYVDRDKTAIASLLTRLRRPSHTLPRRVHISNYVYDNEGERRYPRAVYALGDKPDKKAPKTSVKENKARYWARKVTLMRSNSVFHLGLSREKIKAMHKQLKEQTCTTSSESTPA